MVINQVVISHKCCNSEHLKTFSGLKIEVHLNEFHQEKTSAKLTAKGVDILLEGLLDLSYFIAVFTIHSKRKLKG